MQKQYNLDGLRQNFYKILSKFPGLKYTDFVYNSPKNIKNFEKYTMIYQNNQERIQNIDNKKNIFYINVFIK